MLGPESTPTQDLEFSLRQMVEVGLRALSPGINDPYTAVAVIDRLATSIALVMRRDMEPAVYRDEEGVARLVTRPVTFTGLVDRAFNELRQAASTSPAVLIHLLDSLAELACHCRTAQQRDALARHAGMIASAGHRSVEEEGDAMAISTRYDAVLSSLAVREVS